MVSLVCLFRAHTPPPPNSTHTHAHMISLVTFVICDHKPKINNEKIRISPSVWNHVQINTKWIAKKKKKPFIWRQFFIFSSTFHVQTSEHEIFFQFFTKIICIYFICHKDLRTNEARLQELNSIADRLTVMGHTEAAEKIREQIIVSRSCFVASISFLNFVHTTFISFDFLKKFKLIAVTVQ